MVHCFSVILPTCSDEAIILHRDNKKSKFAELARSSLGSSVTECDLACQTARVVDG